MRLKAPRARPVNESESERQRARNGASESERDFSRERATIGLYTSESKRAKFRMGREFFVLQSFTVYSGVTMSVASTEHGNTVSVQCPLFQ